MDKFTTNHRYREKEMSDMGEEMKGYFVGPMPAAEFLDAFFPIESIDTACRAAQFTKGSFGKVISCEGEKQGYCPFIEAASPFAPSLEFVDSSAHADNSGQSNFSFDIKPDVGVYVKESGRRGWMDVARVELMIEFKWHSADDPFRDPYSISKDMDQRRSFLRNTKDGTDTAGQITAYASAQLGSQFRTCVYSILIVKSYARLIRWDRTGAIVTTPIYHNDDCELAEFFRRYHKAPPKLRGVDTTVTTPTPQEERLARNCLLEVNEKAVLVKIVVPTPNLQLEYIVRAPIASHYTPPGRATRGFEAYDVQRCRKVYVKDTWRVNLPGIEREGETYQLLHAAGVRNLAKCSAAGDIDDHSTLTHLYQHQEWACKTASELVPHHHYRLVLDTVGQVITSFPSSYVMLRSVRDAVHCHEDAVSAGVLHRDISPGNILIVGNQGILIDWDLSKRLNIRSSSDTRHMDDHQTDDNARQPTRTGTWQFMSAALVKNPKALQTFVDDLESFIYVLLWLTLMYSPNSMSPGDLTSCFKTVLDPEQYQGIGGSAKVNFLRSRTELDDLSFPGRPLLQPLLVELATLFAVRYEQKPSVEELVSLADLESTNSWSVPYLPAWKYRKRLHILQSRAHAHVAELLTKAVEKPGDWCNDSCAAPQRLLLDKGKSGRKTKTDWDLSDRG